jgi:hypothetical protein
MDEEDAAEEEVDCSSGTVGWVIEDLELSCREEEF